MGYAKRGASLVRVPSAEAEQFCQPAAREPSAGSGQQQQAPHPPANRGNQSDGVTQQYRKRSGFSLVLAQPPASAAGAVPPGVRPAKRPRTAAAVPVAVPGAARLHASHANDAGTTHPAVQGPLKRSSWQRPQASLAVPVAAAATAASARQISPAQPPALRGPAGQQPVHKAKPKPSAVSAGAETTHGAASTRMLGASAAPRPAARARVAMKVQPAPARSAPKTWRLQQQPQQPQQQPHLTQQGRLALHQQPPVQPVQPPAKQSHHQASQQPQAWRVGGKRKPAHAQQMAGGRLVARPAAPPRGTGVQLIARQSQASKNCTLLYRRSGHKLERTGVRSAVAGAGLVWINGSAGEQLQQAVRGAVAAAEARQGQGLAAAAQRASRRQAAASASAATQRQAAGKGSSGGRAAPKLNRRQMRLVRIGDQSFYVTPKGTRSLQAVEQGAALATAAAAAAKRPAAAGAAGATNSSAKRKPAAGGTGRGSTARGGVGRPTSASSAVGRSVAQASAQSAVQRSLRNARMRNLATRAAKKRGLCPFYCRHGKCQLAQQGQCSQVHDPSKVSVCSQWLAGACTNTACPLQHKVVPELMPVCTFFLQGMCSNASCPYLHVNVSPDAPVCQDFQRGHCPLGSRCPKRHTHGGGMAAAGNKRKRVGAGSTAGGPQAPARPRQGPPPPQQQPRQRPQPQLQSQAMVEEEWSLDKMDSLVPSFLWGDDAGAAGAAPL